MSHLKQATEHYILRWIRSPNKFLCWSKTLIPQCHCCVNNVLSITTNNNKSAKENKSINKEYKLHCKHVTLITLALEFDKLNIVPSIWIVGQCLGEHLTWPHVFDCQRKTFTIFNIIIWKKKKRNNKKFDHS